VGNVRDAVDKRRRGADRPESVRETVHEARLRDVVAAVELRSIAAAAAAGNEHTVDPDHWWAKHDCLVTVYVLLVAVQRNGIVASESAD
jgi:hypothetical protein